MMNHIIWEKLKYYNLLCAVETSKKIPTETTNTKPESTRPSLDATENKDDNANKNITAHTFTFRELATATRNFRKECLIGEGGFGRVYKGKLVKTDQVIISILVLLDL